MRRKSFVMAAISAAAVGLAATPASAGVQPPGWQIAQANLTAGGQSAMSCVSASWCMSVGAKAMVWDGQQWKSSPGSFSFDVRALSCHKSWDCMLVGAAIVEPSRGSTSSALPIALHWDGIRWQTLSPPLQLPGDGYFLGVSCPAANTCLVVGDLRDHVLLWQNGTWTSQAVPLPAGTGSISLYGIDCATAGSCHATGNASDGSYPGRPILAGWDGTAWSTEPVPTDSQGDVPEVTAISCPTTTSCVAVGGVRSRGAAEVWDGTSWTEMQAPASPHASDSGELGAGNYEDMTGVSCWAVDRCQAVGENFTTETHWVWRGGSWLLLDNPAATDDLTDAARLAGGPSHWGPTLHGIECPYASFCLDAGDLSGEVYMERWAPPT